jgi:choline dehydrogenase-like flavoprotein
MWGSRLMAEMEDYNHVVGLKIVGEMLPQESNRVTLADDVDQYGLRIPRVTYSWCDNDKRLIDHSLKFMTQALQAIDARNIWTQDDDTCHLNGTAKMGSDRSNSVVDADCRSWDISNLWICDGSVFPTVGGVNPSLTIQAIACRTADRIRELGQRGELNNSAQRRDQHATQAFAR